MSWYERSGRILLPCKPSPPSLSLSPSLHALLSSGRTTFVSDGRFDSTFPRTTLHLAPLHRAFPSRRASSSATGSSPPRKPGEAGERGKSTRQGKGYHRIDEPTAYAAAPDRCLTDTRFLPLKRPRDRTYRPRRIARAYGLMYGCITETLERVMRLREKRKSCRSS